MLAVSVCASLGCLPDLSALTQLEVAGVPRHLDGWQAGGRKAYTAFDVGGDLSHVEELGLGSAVDAEVASTLGRCVRAKVLYLSSGRELYPAGCLAPLAALEQLAVLYCSQLRSLPASLCELRGLRELRLYRCISLVGLPDGIGALHSLRRLVLQECESMTALPATLGECRQVSMPWLEPHRLADGCAHPVR